MILYLRLYTAGDGEDRGEISLRIDSSISTDTSSSGRLITTSLSSKLTDSEQPTTVQTKQETPGMYHIYMICIDMQVDERVAKRSIVELNLWERLMLSVRYDTSPRGFLFSFQIPNSKLVLYPVLTWRRLSQVALTSSLIFPLYLNIHKHTHCIPTAKQTEQNQTHVHIQRYVFREVSTPRLFDLNFKSQ